MRIGILGGTGRMGKGLARSYVRVGHEVVLGSRDAHRAELEAQAIKSEYPDAKVYGADSKTVADNSDLIVLSVGFRDVAGLVASLSDSLSGKILVDITNPFGAVPVGQTSGVEHNAKAMGGPARWVAAYKTNFWKTLSRPTDEQGMRRDILICSDDEDAKRIVSELAESTGFRVVDCGALENARTLDSMVPLMLQLDARYGGNALSSWKFLVPSNDE